jgi:hypothetical protein
MVDTRTNHSIKRGRRQFLRNAAAAGLFGSAIVKDALGQKPIGGSTREQLRQDMMAAIEPDIKKHLEMRAEAIQELPEPPNLKPGGMLDARFPVYYRTSVPEAMRLLTEYFAAFNDRDMAAVARSLHFPYATYEGAEPLIYKSSEEFIRNPPPSIHESDKPDSELRPGTYDILDVLQVHTFNPVNVGLELSYSRYRADGYRIVSIKGSMRSRIMMGSGAYS